MKTRYKVFGAIFGTVLLINVFGPMLYSPPTTDANGHQHLGGPAGDGGTLGAFLPLLMMGGIGYGLYRWWNRPDTTQQKSDITTVESVKGGTFDPSAHWDPDAGVFLGQGPDDRHAVYIPEKIYLETHMQIIGPTGSGKGVLLGNLAAQTIQAGRGLVVIDPKRDKYMGHILADACRKAGRTLHVVDLQEGRRGGWQPFRAGREQERVSRAVESFDLNPSGSTADFYKIQGKELLTRVMASTDGSIGQVLDWLEQDEKKYGKNDKVPGALERNYFKIWGARKNLNPPGGGFNLNKALAVGDVIYLRTDPNDSELVIPLKAFLMQISQWKFANPESRHLTVIGDEVSLYVSSYLAKTLATIRGTNTNFVLAYQSLSDMETAGKPGEGQVLRQRIDQNCQLKVFYGTQDNLTVETVEQMSGTRGVWKKTQEAGLRGYKTSGRSADEDYLIPGNLIRRLGAGVAVYFEPSMMAQLVVTAPVKTDLANDLENDDRYYSLAGKSAVKAAP